MKKGMSFPPVGVTAEISVIPNEPVSPDPEASGTSWAKVTGVALPRSPRAALLVISKMRTVKKKKKAVNPPPRKPSLAQASARARSRAEEGTFVYAFPCVFIYSVKDIFKLVTLTLRNLSSIWNFNHHVTER